MTRLLLALLRLATPLRAEDDAGVLDYYVLSLSWSANWYALDGDDGASPQCDAAEDFDRVLQGLWPQFEKPPHQDSRFS